jgi:hypothetical protein
MDDGLGESHRRVIGSGMLIVDSAAVRILDLLDERNSPAAIKAVEGSVTEEEKQEIRARLIRLQELIAALVRKYDVEPSKKDLRRILASEVSQIWICLEDSRPARIQGYGTMSASAADALEADLDQMLQIANRLRALLSS